MVTTNKDHPSRKEKAKAPSAIGTDSSVHTQTHDFPSRYENVDHSFKKSNSGFLANRAIGPFSDPFENFAQDYIQQRSLSNILDHYHEPQKRSWQNFESEADLLKKSRLQAAKTPEEVFALKIKRLHERYDKNKEKLDMFLGTDGFEEGQRKRNKIMENTFRILSNRLDERDRELAKMKSLLNEMVEKVDRIAFRWGELAKITPRDRRYARKRRFQ